MIRKRFTWKLKDREIQLGERTLIMGVLNVTPDSFSDGGKYIDPDSAYARALELEDQGADIIDIGAESTRPGSKRLNEEEELKRLVPVLKKLAGRLAIPISVDTYKSGVAARALELGAEIINDPSALTFDPLIPKSVLQHDGALILNHMRGTPDMWPRLAPLPDVVGSVIKDLEASVRKCQLAHLGKERLVLDPGIGFGKRGEQNASLLAKLGVLSNLGLPLMVGPSRKSFLNQTTDEGKLMGTAAAVTAAILGGVHIVRVHDVRQMAVVVKTADEILTASSQFPAQVKERDERPQRRRPGAGPPSSRPPAGADRPERKEPTERGARSAEGKRPDRGDRPERTEPPERGARSADGKRPVRGDRPERGGPPSRGARPGGGGRPDRGGKPSGGGRSGGGRPGSGGGRPSRGGRPGGGGPPARGGRPYRKWDKGPGRGSGGPKGPRNAPTSPPKPKDSDES